MADDAAARSYIQQANDLIANQDFDRATAKLELADVELEDLTGDSKAEVAALIQQAHAAIATARASEHRPKYLRMIGNLMSSAESDIGNLVTWPGTERQLMELFADPVAKGAIPNELAEAEPQFRTFKKLHARKATAELIAQAERQFERATIEWEETKPLFDDPDGSEYGRSRGSERTMDYISSTRRTLESLPQDNDAVKAMVDKCNTLSETVTSIAMAGQAQQMVESLQRRFELYENEFGGWQDENNDAPSWDDYRRNDTRAMSAFGLPLTLAYIGRTEEVLENLKDNSEYQMLASAPAVSAVVDGTRNNVTNARALLFDRTRNIVDSALRAPIESDYQFERLERDIERAFGESSDEANGWRDRIKAKLRAHADGEMNATPAFDYERLSQLANDVYPSMYAGHAWADEIDLSQVEQKIGFIADNLRGWRFTPDDSYYFATTIAGVPIIGRLDKEMRDGIAAIEEAMGRSLGDDDSDGKWDIVAVVTDKKGRLMARRSADSTGTIDGVNVSVNHEYHEPVEAVVVDIVAAKCGPFAGGRGRGVVRPDGTVSA